MDKVDDCRGGQGETRDRKGGCAPLIVLVAARDRDALRDLYQVYAGKMFAILLTWAKSEAEAEQILVDCFVAIWAKAHQFDRVAEVLEIWLFGILRECAIDRLGALDLSNLVKTIPPRAYDAKIAEAAHSASGLPTRFHDMPVLMTSCNTAEK